jgi:hypothetical protein|tara:strand:+ start:398 stop:505 length:108 start_codon:yes stop_codon:yes gene_type:complete
MLGMTLSQLKKEMSLSEFNGWLAYLEHKQKEMNKK